MAARATRTSNNPPVDTSAVPLCNQFSLRNCPFRKREKWFPSSPEVVQTKASLSLSLSAVITLLALRLTDFFFPPFSSCLSGDLPQPRGRAELPLHHVRQGLPLQAEPARARQAEAPGVAHVRGRGRRRGGRQEGEGAAATAAAAAATAATSAGDDAAPPTVSATAAATSAATAAASSRLPVPSPPPAPAAAAALPTSIPEDLRPVPGRVLRRLHPGGAHAGALPSPASACDHLRGRIPCGDRERPAPPAAAAAAARGRRGLQRGLAAAPGLQLLGPDDGHDSGAAVVAGVLPAGLPAAPAATAAATATLGGESRSPSGGVYGLSSGWILHLKKTGFFLFNRHPCVHIQQHFFSLQDCDPKKYKKYSTVETTSKVHVENYYPF